jgi:hypothetical protein
MCSNISKSQTPRETVCTKTRYLNVTQSALPNLIRPFLNLYTLRRFKIRQESRRKTIREGATLYRQSPSLLRAQNKKSKVESGTCLAF